MVAAIPARRANSRESHARRDAELIASLESFIPQLLSITGTAGLSVALASGGELTWEKAFGLADRDRRIPMTTKTVTRAGSMTKLYTGTAVMQLVDRGELGLYDSVRHHLPDLAIANPLGERDISVYDLLTFRSGLSADTTAASLSRPKPLNQHLAEGYQSDTLQEYGHTVPRWSKKVGQGYLYSNFGVATLGYLVERVNSEGLSFPEYVRRHLIDPLGMSSTVLAPVGDIAHLPEPMATRISTGYASFGPVQVPTPLIYSADYPANGLLTTPGDHIRLLLAYLNEGEHQRHRLLKPETVRLMLTPQFRFGEEHHNAPSGWSSGLVFFLTDHGTTNFSFGLDGAHMWGWWNEGRAFPHHDVAVVAAANRWDMLRWHDPGLKSIPGFVLEHVASVLNDGPSSTVSEDKCAPPWAWKTSYLLGALMVERTKGLLGITGDVTPDMLGSLASGVHLSRQPDPGWLWDEAGFRAGAQDMLRADHTLLGLRGLIDSGGLRVGAEDVPLILEGLGAPREVPMPLSFWNGALLTQ